MVSVIKLRSRSCMVMDKEVVVLIEGEVVVKTMIEQGQIVIVALEEVEAEETIKKIIIMNQMIPMLHPNQRTIHLQIRIQKIRMTHYLKKSRPTINKKLK